MNSISYSQADISLDLCEDDSLAPNHAQGAQQRSLWLKNFSQMQKQNFTSSIESPSSQKSNQKKIKVKISDLKDGSEVHSETYQNYDSYPLFDNISENESKIKIEKKHQESEIKKASCTPQQGDSRNFEQTNLISQSKSDQILLSQLQSPQKLQQQQEGFPLCNSPTYSVNLNQIELSGNKEDPKEPNYETHLHPFKKMSQKSIETKGENSLRQIDLNLKQIQFSSKGDYYKDEEAVEGMMQSGDESKKHSKSHCVSKSQGPNKSSNDFLRLDTKKLSLMLGNNYNASNFKKKPKQILNNLINIGIIKSIIVHMKQHVLSRKFDNLSKSNFSLINDFTSFSSESETNKYLFFTKILNLIQFIPIFSPDSPIFIAWSILVFFSILIQVHWFGLNSLGVTNFQQVFLIPLEMSFQVRISSEEFLLGIVYVIEMFVNINSGYFEEGVIVKDRKKIILKYIRSQFWKDLITSLAFYLNSNHKIFILDLLFMIRIANITIMYKEIVQYLQIYRHQAIVDLITLLFWTIFMAHFMGCGFHYISNSEPGTWIDLMKLQNSEWSVRYVYSVYFSLVTMSTIGYGDIYPVSVQEKAYVMVMLVLGCGWFAYVVNTAGQVFSEIQMKKKEVRDKQFKILEYMRSRNVSKNLQLKVVKYLDFMVNKEQNSNSYGQKILESMSKDIREQVILECYKPILKKHFIFRNHFSDPFLDRLISHMKEANFGPGEIIFNQNGVDRQLFFIKEGKVDFFLSSEKESFLISSLSV